MVLTLFQYYLQFCQQQSLPTNPGQFALDLGDTYSIPGSFASLMVYDQDVYGNPTNYYWDTLLQNAYQNPTNVLFVSGFYNYSLRVTSATYSSNVYRFNSTIISATQNFGLVSQYEHTLYYYLSSPGYQARNDYVTSVTISTITHNSNVYPLVQAIDTTGNMILPYEIKHTSTQSFNVYFSSTFSGTIISGGGAGPQGTTGPQGVQGITGPTGAGTQGPTGPIQIAPIHQILFGTGGGLTSSSSFTFDKNNCQLLVGSSHYIYGTSYNSVIVGGLSNTISIDACKSSIIGGETNTITDSCRSSIIGGISNQILVNGTDNSIFGGYGNIITTDISQSGIISGANNLISSCVYNSSIIGGYLNCVKSDSSYSVSDSSIISGRGNVVCGSGGNRFNQVIIGGCNNSICNGNNNGVFGGCSNLLSSSVNSSIIAGQSNTISGSTNSSIIGGSGLSLSNRDNIVYVPSLMVASSSTTKSHINLVAGASPSVPVDGDLWYDGTNLYFQKGATTIQLT
jgi:hypothetical protein